MTKPESTAGRFFGKAARVGAWALAGYGIYRTIKEANRTDDLGREIGFFLPGGDTVEDTVLSNQFPLKMIEEHYQQWLSCKKVLDDRHAPIEHYCKVADALLFRTHHDDGLEIATSIPIMMTHLRYLNLDQQKRFAPIYAECFQWYHQVEQWKREEAKRSLHERNQAVADYLIANGYEQCVPKKTSRADRLRILVYALAGGGLLLPLYGNDKYSIFVVFWMLVFAVIYIGLLARKDARNPHYRKETQADRDRLKLPNWEAASIVGLILVGVALFNYGALFGSDGMICVMFKVIAMQLGFFPDA